MSKPLPRWLYKKYSRLWVVFKDSEMTFNEIRVQFSDKSIGTSLTDMIDCGWLIRISKGVYKLNSPTKMTEVIGNAK